MALNTFTCNCLTPLYFKGLKLKSVASQRWLHRVMRMLQRQGGCDGVSRVGTLWSHGSAEVARGYHWRRQSDCHDTTWRCTSTLRRYQRSPVHDPLDAILTPGLIYVFSPWHSHYHLDTIRLIVHHLYVGL